jgi:hypothetical protein
MGTYNNSVEEIKAAITDALDNIEGDFDSITLTQALNACKSYSHVTDNPKNSDEDDPEDSTNKSAATWHGNIDATLTSDATKKEDSDEKGALYETHCPDCGAIQTLFVVTDNVEKIKRVATVQSIHQG